MSLLASSAKKFKQADFSSFSIQSTPRSKAGVECDKYRERFRQHRERPGWPLSKVDFSEVVAGQNDGIKEVAEQIWLVTFMHDELNGRVIRFAPFLSSPSESGCDDA